VDTLTSVSGSLQKHQEVVSYPTKHVVYVFCCGFFGCVTVVITVGENDVEFPIFEDLEQGSTAFFLGFLYGFCKRKGFDVVPVAVESFEEPAMGSGSQLV
jgi:hypothetical protein